jgi:hypothetical protein
MATAQKPAMCSNAMSTETSQKTPKVSSALASSAMRIRAQVEIIPEPEPWRCHFCPELATHVVGLKMACDDCAEKLKQ